MCLAIPAKITELLPDKRAIVDVGGIQREISIDLVNSLSIGDYVILHAGYALTKLNEEEAKQTLKLFAEMLEEGET